MNDDPAAQPQNVSEDSASLDKMEALIYQIAHTLGDIAINAADTAVTVTARLKAEIAASRKLHSSLPPKEECFDEVPRLREQQSLCEEQKPCCAEHEDHFKFGQLMGSVLGSFFRTNDRGWLSIQDITTESVTWRRDQFSIFTHDGKDFRVNFYLVDGPRGETWLEIYVDIDDEDLDAVVGHSVAAPLKLCTHVKQAYGGVTAHFPGYQTQLYAFANQPVTTMAFRSETSSMPIFLNFDADTSYPYGR